MAHLLLFSVISIISAIVPVLQRDFPAEEGAAVRSDDITTTTPSSYLTYHAFDSVYYDYSDDD